jgi:hypothetical protein
MDVGKYILSLGGADSTGFIHMADMHRATRGFLYQVSEYPSVKLSLTISLLRQN